VRAKKVALIESLNPRWIDIAEHWGAELSLNVTPCENQNS
jgi:hypothetical protein